MNELDRILRALDERELAIAVGRKHDDARLRYSLRSLSVESYSEFERIIGDYYAYHFAACVGSGARLPDFEARQRAKRLIEDEYRQQGQSLNQACDDAIEGMNGGMRRLLDIICDGLKRESQANYIEQIFDTYVAPNRFEDKVTIISQVMRQFGNILPRSVLDKRPEEHAHNYKGLVRVINDSLRRVAKETRR